MATPRTLTIQQLFDYGGGAGCKTTIDALNDWIPGWEETDLVDALAYAEALADRSDISNTNVSICHAMSTAEKKLFVNWGLNKIIAHTPAGYSRKAAMITLKDDLVDYVATPTAAKKTALLATAHAIKPITSQDAEIWVANAFKGITISVANNTVDGNALEIFYRAIIKSGILLGGFTKAVVTRAVLTKMEEILDLID